MRGLGAIWTGHMRASSARVAGLVDGDDDALVAADAVFAGSPPWMSDAF